MAIISRYRLENLVEDESGLYLETQYVVKFFNIVVKREILNTTNQEMVRKFYPGLKGKAGFTTKQNAETDED